MQAYRRPHTQNGNFLYNSTLPQYTWGYGFYHAGKALIMFLLIYFLVHSWTTGPVPTENNEVTGSTQTQVVEFNTNQFIAVDKEHASPKAEVTILENPEKNLDLRLAHRKD